MWQTLQASGCLAERGTATIGCLPVIIGNIIFWLLVLAGIVALFMIILSGFKFVTSGGDAKKAEGARKTLTFTVLGLMLIFSAFIILPFIARLTGVRNACISGFSFTSCVPDDIRSACSPSNPGGYCAGGKTCVETRTSPASRPIISCRYLCERDQNPSGWCPGTKQCKRFNHLGDVMWSCQQP